MLVVTWETIKQNVWFLKKLRAYCDRAYHALYSDGKEKERITYEPWMTPLFHKEIIDLKKFYRKQIAK